ncbi:MAG: hypothetical protein QNJ30_11725 [Kiloniellales bacterium]|nr:hypothetical protein [Kiloniellales bacterium]
MTQGAPQTRNAAAETGGRPELTPAELAERMTDAAGRLSEVIEAEVGLLQAFEIAQVERLQADKKALAADYETLLRGLGERPEAVAEMGEARRAALRAAAERLARATEANAVALRAGIEAHTRLMSGIARAVQEQRPRSACYHADGRAVEAEADKAPVAVSLDQVL